MEKERIDKAEAIVQELDDILDERELERKLNGPYDFPEED